MTARPSALSIEPWRDAPPADRGAAIAIVSLAVIAAAAAGAFLAALFGAPWWSGATTGVVALSAWAYLQGRLAVAAAGGPAAAHDGTARLRNIVIGTANDLGMPVPETRVIDDAAPNAAVFPGSIVAVTSGALDSLSLTELESVVAHCLRRIQTGGLVWAAVAAALPVAAGSLAPRVGEQSDIAAAEATRYPPALAKAIGACVPRRGRFAPFWFVAEGPSHDPADVRIASILDL